MTTAYFLPWSHADFDHHRDAVDFGHDEPAPEHFTFSDRLQFLRWETPLFNNGKEWAPLFGQSKPAQITWRYTDPVCHTFNYYPGNFTNAQNARIQPHMNAIEEFRKIQVGCRIEVLTRGSKKLVSNIVESHVTFADNVQIKSFNFFVGQPVPTPPHYWRYAKRRRINEHAVAGFPELDSPSEIEAVFRKRTKPWTTRPEDRSTFAQPIRAAKHLPTLRYLDERHYEVVKTGDLLRDVQVERLRKSQGLYNGTYDFDFQPLMTSTQIAERSYMVRLHLRTSESLASPSPASGTVFELDLKISGAVTEFTGQIIPPSIGENNEFHITVILTRKSGKTGFV